MGGGGEMLMRDVASGHCAGHCICDWQFFVEVGKRTLCLGNLWELEGAHKVIGEGIWSLQGAGED